MDDEQPVSQIISEGIDIRTDELQVLKVGLKRCTSCGQDKPLDAENWYRNRHSEDGFHNECKECRAASQLASRKRVNDRLAAEILSLESRSVDALAEISKPRNAQSHMPHEAEVYEEIMAIFGGAAGLARHLYANYLAATLGRKERVEMLRMVTNMAARISESGAADRELENMDYDALLALFQRLIKSRLQQSSADLAIATRADPQPTAMAPER